MKKKKKKTNKELKQDNIKKKEKNKNNYIYKIKENINNHKNDLSYNYIDNNNRLYKNWFNIDEYSIDKTYNNINIINNISNDNDIIKCQKIIMILTNHQKQILDNWFYTHTKMYNETLKYIFETYNINKCDIRKTYLKKLKADTKNGFYNYINLRAEMKNKTDELIKKSGIDEKTKIHTHTLNYAIRQLCSNIKSACSNMLNGHIKRFRLKYWKYNRPSKSIDIETSYINKENNICYKQLGDIVYHYNGKEIKLKDININCNVKINYNNITKQYTLLIPIKEEPIENINKESNLISLDPGLRTFMTGVSEDGGIKIGDNINNIIEKEIIKINKLKNNNILNKKKIKKKERRINKKISNKIDELHWQTANFLVKKYNTILLGDMSAKSIVCKNNNILRPTQKQACLRTKYYMFRQRLEYKCRQYKTNYYLVNESYTSRLCSYCGNDNVNLKGLHIYNCKNCDHIIDRDFNGARNIYIKHLI
jgi:IS605 OrfB family transposase